MKEIKLSLVRGDITAKSLQRDNMNHIFVRFPLFWEHILNWLRPKTKVCLAISEDGKTISVTCLSPTSEKEIEQKGGE